MFRVLQRFTFTINKKSGFLCSRPSLLTLVNIFLELTFPKVLDCVRDSLIDNTGGPRRALATAKMRGI